MQEKVKTRLKTLGYEYTDDDKALLDICIQLAKNKIFNICHITKLNDKVSPIAVDMACGEFLLSKHNSGQLDIDIKQIVKRLQEGDTTIEFDNSTDTASINALIDYLLNSKIGELACLRKLAW